MKAKARISRRHGKVSLVQRNSYIHYSPVIFTQGKFPAESVEYSEANDSKKLKPSFSCWYSVLQSRDHCS